LSRTRADRIHCPCGAVLEVYVADSLNAGRHPQLRELLLARRLHLFTCGHCGQADLLSSAHLRTPIPPIAETSIDINN
jgi:hypothetical protein